MSEVQVAVLESCPVLREGLRLVLLSLDLEVVGTAENAEDAVSLCSSRRPQVLLIGPSFPAVRLLAMLRLLRAEVPDARVVVFRLVEGADYFSVLCVAAGAAGYLSQVHSCEELATAVRTVADRGHFFSRSIVDLFTSQALGEAALPHDRLSPRELEVFLLLGAGHSVGQIASRLDISPKTVSTHRARIREKTGLSSNSEIIRYALERSLV